MDSLNLKKEDTQYPFIVFTVADRKFCVNSKYISTILQLPHYEQIPESPPYITGIFSHRDEIIKMIDIRNIFGLQSLTEAYEQFAQMIDDRKQDHVRWVLELERTAESGEPFMLARDPHKCAFGKWYDHYHTEQTAIAHHLKKIDEPHRRLHEAADKVNQCEHKCDSCTRDVCLKSTLSDAKNVNMPMVLQLLDETKDLFRSTVYHEMVLILGDGSNLGLVVDEVLSVEELTPSENRDTVHMFNTSALISKIQKSQKTQGIILEINMKSIAQLAN